MNRWLLFTLLPLFGLQFVIAQIPVVLWHGMGDDCCNPESMGRITDLLKSHIPGVFVHSIMLGDNVNDDRNAGFFGVVNDQVDHVCAQLARIPQLANGFNAIGFSQGGLFMRAYVERCNQPRVRHLITFGSPHGGVIDIPNCVNIHDFKCILMRTMVNRGVYTNYVQRHVVQAQYYKSPTDLQVYLEKNIFLPRINNQVEPRYRNATYRDHLGSLETFVMIKFTEDTMIKPPESAWFWTVDMENQLTPLEHQALYQEDWLGLQLLDQRARLKFLSSPGVHMQISDEYFIKQVIQPYLANDQDEKMNSPRIQFVNQQV